MSAHNTAAKAVDPDSKWLYRVGGISALLVGLGYIVIIPLFAIAGFPPDGGEARLIYLAEHTSAWWAIIGLSVFTDLLYIPVALALYLALKRINRGAMLLAAASLALFAALELAITWPSYAALINLSAGYAAPINEAQRTLFIAAATYSSAVLENPLVAIYTIFVPGLGIFLASLVMLKGVFNKATAYAGTVTGMFAVIASIGPLATSALDFAVIVVSTFTLIWFLLVGYQLFRLSQQR